MTDYWVSTKKHYCEVCRCWVSGHSNNVKKHESSARHISSLKSKMIESHRKKVAQRKQEELEAEEMKRLNSITLDNPVPTEDSQSMPYVNTMFSYGPLIQQSLDVETEKKRIMNTINRSLAGIEQPEHVELKPNATRWTASIDQDDGTLVYYNRVTGVRTKNKPKDFDGVLPSSSAYLTSNWVLKYDPKKRCRYYHNTDTGEVRWLDDKPIASEVVVPQEKDSSRCLTTQDSSKSDHRSDIKITMKQENKPPDTSSIKFKFVKDENKTNETENKDKQQEDNNKEDNKRKEKEQNNQKEDNKVKKEEKVDVKVEVKSEETENQKKNKENEGPVIGKWEVVDPKDSVFSHCVENMDVFLDSEEKQKPQDVVSTSFKPNKRLFKNLDDPVEVSKPVYKKNTQESSEDNEPETVVFKKRKIPKGVNTSRLV